LVVKDELANGSWKLFALPPALEPSSGIGLTSGSRRTRRFDRVGRRTQLVSGEMRRDCGLAGGESA
jgi:hypothetical protein